MTTDTIAPKSDLEKHGEPSVDFVQAVIAFPVFDPQLFVNFLVKVFQQLLTGLLHFLINLRLQFVLEGIEIQFDLLRRSASLINLDDALLKIHA